LGSGRFDEIIGSIFSLYAMEMSISNPTPDGNDMVARSALGLAACGAATGRPMAPEVD
jgi:hypothetical protein